MLINGIILKYKELIFMFKENYIMNGIIYCKTGLHIGGSNDSVEIGGSDNVIIRDSINNYPFIPGSSLKGKLRSLMELNDVEYVDNLIEDMKAGKDEPSKESDIAVRIFGGSVENKTIQFPTRIIVRDSFPTKETINKWNEHPDIINGAELKYENQLNRLKASANPRNIERVPKGSEFEFEIILSVYDEDEKQDNIINIINAMILLEDNYLGGSGTRGFGQVSFKDISIYKRDQSYYKENKKQEPVVVNKSLEDARNDLIEYFN